MASFSNFIIKLFGGYTDDEFEALQRINMTNESTIGSYKNDIDNLNEEIKVLNEKNIDLNTKLELYAKSISSYEDTIAKLTEDNKSLNNMNLLWKEAVETDEKKISALETELEHQKNIVAKQEDEISRLNTVYSALIQSTLAKDDIIIDLKNKIAELEEKLSKYEKTCVEGKLTISFGNETEESDVKTVTTHSRLEDIDGESIMISFGDTCHTYADIKEFEKIGISFKGGE